MIPVDQDPGNLPDVPGCAMYRYHLIRLSRPWMCADVYRCTCTTRSLGNTHSLSCLPPPSSHLPHISSLTSPQFLNRRAAQAQGIVARPTACGQIDQTDRHARPPGSWLLASWLPVPDAWAGARRLAGSLTRQISSGSLVYDATEISFSQSQEPNLNVSRLQWHL